MCQVQCGARIRIPADMASSAPTDAPHAAGSAPNSRRGRTTSPSPETATRSPASAHGNTADPARELALTTAYNGLYMVYNLMAACTAACGLGADPSRFQDMLNPLRPHGRAHDALAGHGPTVASDLAKNPVGFDRQIQQMKASNGRLMAFFLNDAEADGYVSWIGTSTSSVRRNSGDSRLCGRLARQRRAGSPQYAGIDAQIVERVEQALAIRHRRARRRCSSLSPTTRRSRLL